MADYTPVFTPGQSWVSTASATITGGTLVEVSGNGTVGPAGASSAKVVGVAAFDATNGARVTVWLTKSIHEVTASGAVTAGDQLAAAAAGKVSTVAAASGNTAGDINAARAVIGVALTTVADGAKCRFVLT